MFQVQGTAYANSQEHTKVWLGQGTVWSVGNYKEVLMNLKKFRGNKLIMEEEVGGSEATQEATAAMQTQGILTTPCPPALSISTLPVVQGLWTVPSPF